MKLTLNQRIELLEQEIVNLKAKLRQLSDTEEHDEPVPYSKVGGIRDRSLSGPVEPGSGAGGIYGGLLAWNDLELLYPSYGAIAPDATPNKAYNKHSHTRWSGGALISEQLEIVEYEDMTDYNPHTQQFWTEEPNIKLSNENEHGLDGVQMIGPLHLDFDAKTKSWGVKAIEIDIKSCYFVERDSNGNIVNDENGNPKRSPLYNEDGSKNAITWDKNARCWRLFATYSEYDPTA